MHGERFHYASIETAILARVLRRATGQSLTRLAQDRLWQPMGAIRDLKIPLAASPMILQKNHPLVVGPAPPPATRMNARFFG